MSDQPTVTQPPAEPEIIFGFGGRALRQINPNRLFKTGDHLVNRAGQELWEVLAFHPKGVRVIQWPHGNPVDWTWETVYSFYERVPQQDRTKPTPCFHNELPPRRRRSGVPQSQPLRTKRHG